MENVADTANMTLLIFGVCRKYCMLTLAVADAQKMSVMVVFVCPVSAVNCWGGQFNVIQSMTVQACASNPRSGQSGAQVASLSTGGNIGTSHMYSLYFAV